MPTRISPPATKEDIEQLADLIGSHYDRTARQIADLQEHMEQWKEDLIEQFTLTVDEIRREMRGANRDELQTFRDRLRNLEQLFQRIAA